MDATTATSVAATDQIAILQPGGFAFATVAQIQADPVGQIAALTTALAALTLRVSAIEGRPEEAAHFTASAKLPALTVGQTVTLTLTGLVPAAAGDRIRKGEAVLVEPAAGLPTGINIAAAYVVADDTVAVQLTTGLNLAAGTAAIAWTITALR